MGVFNKTIIPLALVGYEMIIANSARGIIVKYNPYRYLCTQRVWYLRSFDLKKGIDFVHFGLESDMVFEGTIQECEASFQFLVDIEGNSTMQIRISF